jgi:hypothetical protein
LPKRKHTIFRELKRLGLIREIGILIFSTRPLLRGIEKIGFFTLKSWWYPLHYPSTAIRHAGPLLLRHLFLLKQLYSNPYYLPNQSTLPT